MGVWLVWLWAALGGCGVASDEFRFETPAPEGSSLPNLSLDTRARPVLSWVEPRGEGHALVYAVLRSEGWDEPVTVAEGRDWFVNWADFPSVQPLGDELWASHWLVKQPGGMYSYDIYMSLSNDGGSTWGRPFRPHDDDTPTEHGFVSLWPKRLSDGKPAVGAVWLDGRHTLLDPSRTEQAASRMTLRSAVFDADGMKVSAEEVDRRVCECCQTDVALTREGALVAYRDRSAEEVRDIHVTASTAGGWENLGAVADDGWRIEGCPVNGPAIAASDGGVVVAWYTEASGRPRVQVVRRAGPHMAWPAPNLVDGASPLGRVDLAMLADGDAAVSWLARARKGHSAIHVARVGRDGTVGAPLEVARTQASRPAGFPRVIRNGDHLLLAWTHWQDGVSQVATARVATAELPPPAG